MPDDDIDYLAAAKHVEGYDTIDVAVSRVATLIEVRDEVLAERADKPDAFAVFGPTAPDVIARRVVGSLLNAGWTPPSTEEVERAVQKTEEARARFQAWRDALAPDEWQRIMAYFSEHGDYPPDSQPPTD